jgi:hypothetical protein
MDFGSAGQRPVWLDAALTFAVGLAGQILLLVALGTSDGAVGPVAGLVGPAAVGAVASLVSRRGLSIGPVVLGIVLAFQAVQLIAARDADVVSVALAAVAGAFGFAAVWGARQSQGMSGMPKPPRPADRDRLEAELTTQLRAIDPSAPGSFEQATVLLRQVNEQLGMFGPFSPWSAMPSAEQQKSPTGLLRIQAELVEAARMSALAAGARRFTVTSTGGSIDIQAVFGDPIVGEPAPPPDGIRPVD